MSTRQPGDACALTHCSVAGSSTCVVWGIRLCYRHFAELTAWEGAPKDRRVTADEWRAFVAYVRSHEVTAS